MSYRIIQNILDTATAAITYMPTIVAENDEITRTSSTATSIGTEAYTRTTLLPATTDTTTIGLTGIDRFNGLYQIDLFFPTNDGVDGTNYMVDAILTAFPKATFLTQSGITLRIVNHWREASIQGTNWFVTPVILQWESHIER